MEKVLKVLENSEVVFLDTETTGLSPDEGKLRLLQIATPESEVFVIDAFKTDLKPILREIEKKFVVGHNLKFDLKFLGIYPEKVWDTMIAEQLIYTRKRGEGELWKDVSLEKVAKRYTGKTLRKEIRNSSWQGELTKEQIEYAKRDVEVLKEIFPKQVEEIKEKYEDLGFLIKRKWGPTGEVPLPVAIEMAFVPVLARSENHGVFVDERRIKEMRKEIKMEMEKIIAKFLRKGVNVFSPKQVKAYLEGKLKTELPSTSEQVLLQIQDEEAREIALARKLKKYSDKLEEFLKFRKGERVKAQFVQVGAISGRMTCKNPNLQNVPRVKEMREVISAPEGKVLIVADFPQIELRIAAVYSWLFCKKRNVEVEPVMARAFMEGKDLHRLTASLLTGKPEEKVTKEERQLAKAVNFGLIYGASAKTLVAYARANYGVEMTPEEARLYVRRFFESYPELKKWHEIVRKHFEKNQAMKVQSLSGRTFITLKENDALNYPVQSLGADMLKLSAIRIDRKIRNLGGVIVNYVHDEIIVECPENRAEEVKNIVEKEMQDSAERLLNYHARKFGIFVPVPVEATVSPVWKKE